MEFIKGIEKNLPDEAHRIIDAGKDAIREHPDVTREVLERAGILVDGIVPPDSIALARNAIGSALKEYLTKGTIDATSPTQNLVYIDNGPLSNFQVKADKTMVFRAVSNASYHQVVKITISGPSGSNLASTVFRGNGENNATMKNEAGKDFWRYRISGASDQSVWTVTMAFYHVENGGNLVGSKATGSINNCYGSARSEDWSDHDGNDTIVTVSER